MRHRLRLSAAVVALLGCCLAYSHGAVAGRVDAEEFRRDLRALCQSDSRSVGSPGYDEAAAYIEREIGKLPNVQLRRHEYSVMVPVTRSAALELPGGRSERVFPFAPAHVRVCSTPPQGIAGKLVYAGECRYEQLRPASLRGQIAVVEASARDRWTDAFDMGAKAMLILGRDDTSWDQLNSHDLRIPVNLPRFYVPPGRLADDLRAGRLTEGKLRATVVWERKRAVNYYALVPAARRMPEGWREPLPPAALMFSVPLDSSSLVPDLAPGASQAVQTASGLAMLRHVASQAWDRPVILFFGGGDSVQFLATRNMLLALAQPPATWSKELISLSRNIADCDRDLSRARDASAADGAPRISITADRDLIARVVKIIDTDLALEQDRLFRIRAIDRAQRTAEQLDVLRRLEDRQATLNRLKYAYQQDPKSLADPALAGEAREYLTRTIQRLGGGSGDEEGLLQQHAARKAELEQRISLYHWLADATGRPRDPDAAVTDARLIELLVGLDLSDRGTRCGPMYWGFFQRITSMPQIQEYRDWFAGVQREAEAGGGAAAWWSAIAAAVDLDPLTRQSRAPSTYLAGPLPIASELAQAWGVPGLAMVTLNDLRLRRDTPSDTLEHLNVDAILPQLDGVAELFARAAADARFVGPVDLKHLNVELTGQVVSPAPGRPVPDLPRPGFLASYSYVVADQKRMPQLGGLPWTLGVRRTEVRECDAEGRYRFEGLPRLRADRLEGIEKQQADMQVLAVQVYRLDRESGAVTATTDLGKQAGDIKWWVDMRLETSAQPLRSLVFDCEEFTLTRLYDPRFLQTLSTVVPLHARRNADPPRFSMMMAQQMLAGFLEPGTPAYLLVRYGRVGNRLVLLNAPDDLSAAKGKSASAIERELLRGYTPRELNDLGPLALATAKDFYRLDDARLSEYRRAGVSATLLDDLHADAARQITAAEAAVRADDGLALARSATGAWANEARVYHAAQAMARDVVRAAIFLLLLCVPFSFCMERLLIATPNVYKQIAGTAAIFAIMTAALWSFHPAFKISASPLIIVLAFAIILMSVVVIFVVYGKFDTELKRLRSGRDAGAVAAGFAHAGVMMSGVNIGLANMRRRKFRTALTSITVVLITFTVLCFTSTTRYVGSIATPTGVASSHPGILLRQRGFRAIPDILPDQLRAVLTDPGLKLPPNVNLVERWWAVSTSEPNEQYHITASGQTPRTVALPAILGLTPGESRLSRIAEVIGAAKFARLERGETDVIYLSTATAKQLGVREGDRLRLGGLDLQLAGIYDPSKFDREVLTLAGDSLAPLKYTSGQLDAGGRKLDDSAAESLELDAGGASEAGATYEFLSSTDFAIVPADVCRRLYKSTLRSVTFRLEDQSQVKSAAQELSRRFSLALFAGYDDGVRMISASNLSSVSGAGSVAIPLLVGGLIIFNTMMGSIAERRREIHIYTSIGLAPAHVGALFIAEALTYGLIGTVFGYVIGQAAGTLLLKLGWLGPVTLNYSGSSAMMTMGLILLIVMASSIVPARLASKIAAPSIERTWKVPAPRDGTIEAALPFTINKTAAGGVLAYLLEFFADHRHGNIGKFAAGKVEPLIGEDVDRGSLMVDGGVGAAEGSPSTIHHPPSTSSQTRGLRTSIWLTPFDLGVRQQLELLIYPGAVPDVYEVRVILKRLSGDDGNWQRMNRRFLTELRKRFLQWRSLSPARMLEYVEQSKALFTPALGPAHSS